MFHQHRLRNRYGWRASLALCGLFAWVGCSNGATGPASTGGTVTQTVGPAGGTVAVDGAALAIPPAALAADEAISITSTNSAPPQGVTSLSPIYEFGPQGLVFILPPR